jgi:ubiquitin-conjugating enzyme E2 variant
MFLPFELAAGWLAADFVSGLVHWAEDTFGTESTPILGRWVVAPNVRHHLDPTAFVRKSWIASNWDLAAAAAAFLGVALLSGSLGPGAVLFALAGANANQIHKWCHAPATAPRFVRALWRAGILQSPRQHAVHHARAKNEAYCVVSPFLNPILDRLRFWRALERCTVPILGAPRRHDLVRSPRAAPSAEALTPSERPRGARGSAARSSSAIPARAATSATPTGPIPDRR